MSNEQQILKQIVERFRGIAYDELSQLERQVLCITLTGLNYELKLDSNNEINFQEIK